MKIEGHWKEPLSLVLEHLNKPVDAIYRVLSVVDGITDWSEGFLQLKFSDESWLLLTGDSDGETFLAKPERWHDPLEGILDFETETWVKEYGKDELIEVSGLAQYSEIVGKHLTDFKAILYQIGEFHALCGVQLVFDGKILDFKYVADSCLVEWTKTLQNPPYEIVDKELILKNPD